MQPPQSPVSILGVKAVSIIIFALFALLFKATAADTLIVIFDKQNMVSGDSIQIEVYAEPYKTNPPAQTLHLWIDNIKTGQRWKYRYAFVKGRCNISLKINDSIPHGTYAFNFLLQNRFLTINGKLTNVTGQDKSINFLAKAKNKAPVIDDAVLQPGGNFKIDHLYFTDSVLFGFSPVQQKKENRLKIIIETPVDSAFTPVAMQTEFVTVGKLVNEILTADTTNQAYVFSLQDKIDKQLLNEVTIKAKIKAKRKKYEDENVSGLFAAENSITIDFYDSDELNSYTDIYSYLVFKMPGLQVFGNPENGQPLLFWRNEKTDVYVDEFADTDFSPYSLSVKDIEMIKIFRPGTRTGLDGLGGTVAIYTKKFSNRQGNKLSNYSFYVKGYTQKNAEWK